MEMTIKDLVEEFIGDDPNEVENFFRAFTYTYYEDGGPGYHGCPWWLREENESKEKNKE